MARVESLQPIPDELADEFAGKWVVIRGREVVAAADTYEELMAGRELEQGDLLWCVPPTANLFY